MLETTMRVTARLWMYSMQRADNIHDPIDLKLTHALNLFTAESRAFAEHDINPRTQSCESVGCVMMSQLPIPCYREKN
ncbi:hypothetical protein TNCV_478481 [Trichonephila clavipes]|nr:hypothetical protein TNCV_478481 [Trichonephila clavipes]